MVAGCFAAAAPPRRAAIDRSPRCAFSPMQRAKFDSLQSARRIG